MDNEVNVFDGEAYEDAKPVVMDWLVTICQGLSPMLPVEKIIQLLREGIEELDRQRKAGL